jgi:molybdopterin molybdotransferase
MSGLAEVFPTPMPARLKVALPENDQRQDYLRATLSRGADGTLEAAPFEKQDSSMISLLARADCLVMRAPHAPAAKVGDWAEIISLTAL